MSDRIVFGRLVQVLVLGTAYVKFADSTCSAATIRRRRDEWIQHGILTELEQICLDSCDEMVGLHLEDLSVDGCIVKAPYEEIYPGCDQLGRPSNIGAGDFTASVSYSAASQVTQIVRTGNAGATLTSPTTTRWFQ